MAARKDSTGPGPTKRRLGRGLGSLISAPVKVEVPRDEAPDAPSNPPPPTPPKDAEPASGSGIRMVETARITPNRLQPRTIFDEAGLAALAESIRQAGIMQPVVVRPSGGGGFELIAGERRWRAAGLVGLDAIPAVVRDVDDRTAAELALIENIQREDLNPIDRAEGFKRLTDDFGLTHREVAERVGLNRSSVTNHLRLLELDETSRAAVSAGLLSLGHAKALLAVTNIDHRRALAARALRDGWTVRELERRAQQISADAAPKQRGAAANALPAHMRDLEKRLGEHLGTRVRLQTGRRKGTGRLTIEFYSLDEFDGLMSRLDFSAT